MSYINPLYTRNFRKVYHFAIIDIITVLRKMQVIIDKELKKLIKRGMMANVSAYYCSVIGCIQAFTAMADGLRQAIRRRYYRQHTR